MRVTIVITSYQDRRIKETLSTLALQERRPEEVLIADGSVDPAFRSWLDEVAAGRGARIVHEERASVARARNLALDAASGSILAFLDTDQRAPPGWLAALAGPIEDEEADWVGGPTRPLTTLRLMELKEERLYAAARRDATRLPMGNSAWRRAVFDRIGRFDERLAGGGEDWDIALRASSAGFHGAVAENAWVWHDLRGLDSYRKVARKQFRYNVGGAMAYMKNRRLGSRLGARQPKVGHHWFDAVEPLLKAAALPVAWWRLRRIEDEGAPRS